MSHHTLQLPLTTIEAMQDHYAQALINPVPHSLFRAKWNGVTITAYKSGKVLFQGNGLEAEIARWQTETSHKVTPVDSGLPQGFDQWNVIGSDEVGNGSYFGALCVAAVYVPTHRQALMQTLGVKDSKALNDTHIKELAWQIKECVPYHLTVCPPLKYNEQIDRLNANGMKVVLHNFTLNKLFAKLSPEDKDQFQGVLIDQFTSPSNYFKYVQKEPQPFTEKLYFAQKGESHHLAVACASILARASFLESLETLGKPYHCVLPSGAGANVDQFAKRLVAQYGTQVLEKTAKLHFANTKKIIGK